MRGFNPTPEEIQQQCEAIQATWSIKERKKRRLDFHRVKFIPKYVYLQRRVKGVFETIKLV